MKAEYYGGNPVEPSVIDVDNAKGRGVPGAVISREGVWFYVRIRLRTACQPSY